MSDVKTRFRPSEVLQNADERESRTTPARAKALLMRLGGPGEMRDDDRMDAPDEPDQA